MGNKKKAKRRSEAEEIRSPRLLKLKDAAVYLATSTGSLRRVIQSGLLPVLKGDATEPWRLDVRDLDRYIEQEKRTL
jgi:Helix-turn-helix domain